MSFGTLFHLYAVGKKHECYLTHFPFKPENTAY